MPPKILIVDDDPDMRRMLRGMLAPLGAILEAGNADAALDAIARERPRLVLLDLVMPGEDGLAVLARAREFFPSLCVIVLTGQNDVDAARAALERGARAFVTKPFDPGVLRAEVERLTRDEPPSAGPDARPWRVEP